MAISPGSRKKENCILRLHNGAGLPLTHREFERLVLPELDSVDIECSMKDNGGRLKRVTRRTMGRRESPSADDTSVRHDHGRPN